MPNNSARKGSSRARGRRNLGLARTILKRGDFLSMT
jgi:hypothetical protein